MTAWPVADRPARTMPRTAPAPRTVRFPALSLRLPSVAGVRGVALTVAGLGCLSAAAWLLAVPAGLAAAGLSLLTINWLSEG